MKNFLMFAAMMTAWAAVAEPRDFYKMSQDEIAAHDKVEWSGRGNLASDDQKEYNQMKASMSTLEKAMDKAISEKVFADASKDSTMQSLFEILQKPLVANKKRVNSPSGSFTIGDSQSQGLKALDSLAVMLNNIDGKSRQAVMKMVDYTIVMRLTERYSKFSKAIERINVWQHSKMLADFDEKYGKFQKLLALSDAEILSSTSGADMLQLSGLSKYATDDCKKEPFFDRDVRTIDSYLAPLNENELSKFKEYLETFEGLWTRTLATVKKDNAYFREHALNLAPVDRKAVDALYYDFGTILEEAENYIKAAKELVAKVDESGSEIYKLRRGEVSNSSGWMDCAGSIQSNGCPGYSRRGRRALEDIKDAFKKRRRDLNLSKCTWE